MEPIPETADAFRKLEVGGGDATALRAALARAVAAAASAVPSCVGVSLTLYDDGVPFTFTCAPPVVAEVDAAQYLDGGPCVAAAEGDGDQRWLDTELLDEGRWQDYAAAASAHGIRSSLSLPLRRDHQVCGAVNFYSSEPDAFLSEDQELARTFGLQVEEVVRNADLSFLTLEQARRLPRTLDEQEVVSGAVGVHMARHGVDAQTAREQLAAAADMAGISLVQLAGAVLASSTESSG